jgi:hypothetical protein
VREFVQSEKTRVDSQTPIINSTREPADKKAETSDVSTTTEESVAQNPVVVTPNNAGVVSWAAVQQLFQMVHALDTKIDELARTSRTESPAGSAARDVPKKKTAYRRVREDGEASYGQPVVKMPTRNFVEFYSAVDGTGFVGNGVLVQGKLFSLAHVADHARSIRVAGELIPLDDLGPAKRRSVAYPQDEVVSYPIKRALQKMTKVKFAPDPADVGDAVFGQPLIEGVGHYTDGTVRTRSASDGEDAYTYTVSTSTIPGCSGAPFFVESNGATYLLGLHFGDGGDGNLIVGISSKDFQ